MEYKLEALSSLFPYAIKVKGTRQKLKLIDEFSIKTPGYIPKNNDPSPNHP